MAYSDDYLRQLGRRTAKGEAMTPEMVRKLFLQYLTDIPEDLCWDIFSYFIGDFEPEKELSKEKAECLSVVIDLFEGEYDEKTLSLTDDELRYISEGVNDYAQDISDEMLMNVMQAAVSRGLLR